jgi:hypothetical protein
LSAKTRHQIRETPYSPVRLRLDDLQSLEDVLIKGFPYVRIVTDFGTTEFDASSVDEFAAAANRFPDELGFLFVSAHNEETLEHSTESVALRCTPWQIDADFYDLDEARMLGRERRIREWFNQRKTWYGHFSLKRMIMALFVVMMFASGMLALFVILNIISPSPYTTDPSFARTMYILGIYKEVMLAAGSLLIAVAAFSLTWFTQFFKENAEGSLGDSLMPSFVLQVRQPHKQITLANVSALAGILGLVLAILAFFVHIPD